MISTLQLGQLGRNAVARSYATLNPSDKSASLTLSNGNLTATRGAGTAYAMVRSTIALPDRGYFEVQTQVPATVDGMIAGLVLIGQSTASYPGGATPSNGFAPAYQSGHTTGYKNGTGTNFNAYAGLAAGDYLHCAYDITAGKVWFRTSPSGSAWAGGGDPAAGTSPTQTFTAGSAFYFGLAIYSNTQNATVNFGASAFNGAVPLGFPAGVYT